MSGLDPSELEKEILFYKPNVIGETGLDYFRNLSPRDLQIQSFEFHIQIAIENALPLFLHQREAHEDFVSVLKAFKSKLRWKSNRDLQPCETGKDLLSRYPKKAGLGPLA